MTEQLKEYLEQEGMTHDDVINNEIEQEHKNKTSYTRVEEASEEMQKILDEKMDNKNYYPMSINFSLSTICFVDMKGFNSQQFMPLEIDEKRKEFISKQLVSNIEKIAKEIRMKFTEQELCLYEIDAKTKPFSKAEYMLKALIAGVTPPPFKCLV